MEARSLEARARSAMGEVRARAAGPDGTPPSHDVGRRLSLVDDRLLGKLLEDKTTGESLRWATDCHAGLSASDQMTPDHLTGPGSPTVRARAGKGEAERARRTREQAEVFTPAWVCNEQNNLVDEAWFGHASPFNDAAVGGWATRHDKVAFDDGHSWRGYVDRRVLEVSCGEAPYLTSRYDVVTGEWIPLDDRIGLLDRKLRAVRENAADAPEWDRWTRRAFEAAYGFDLQGDDVLLARANLLSTFEEHSLRRPGGPPPRTLLRGVANVICWNVFQMDGLTFSAPYASQPAAQRSLMAGPDGHGATEPVPCLVYDWRARRPVEYRSLVGR